jgi:hypothetical protein
MCIRYWIIKFNTFSKEIWYTISNNTSFNKYPLFVSDNKMIQIYSSKFDDINTKFYSPIDSPYIDFLVRTNVTGDLSPYYYSRGEKEFFIKHKYIFGPYFDLIFSYPNKINLLKYEIRGKLILPKF